MNHAHAGIVQFFNQFPDNIASEALLVLWDREEYSAEYAGAHLAEKVPGNG